MDRREARQILANELAKYQTWSYDQLRAIVDAKKRTSEVRGTSGNRYCIDIYATGMPNPKVMSA